MTGYFFIVSVIFFAWMMFSWSSRTYINMTMKTFHFLMFCWSIFEAGKHFGFIIKV